MEQHIFQLVVVKKINETLSTFSYWKLHALLAKSNKTNPEYSFKLNMFTLCLGHKSNRDVGNPRVTPVKLNLWLPVDDFHGVQGHLHVDKHAEVLGDLTALHQLEQHLNGNQRVILHQQRQLRTKYSQ